MNKKGNEMELSKNQKRKRKKNWAKKKEEKNK